MIPSLEYAGTLECPQIGHILHHTERMAVAPGVAADRARIRRIEVAASPTHTDGGGSVAHGPAQWLKQRFAFLEQYERRAPGRTRAKPGQLREKLHQFFDFRSGGQRRHISDGAQQASPPFAGRNVIQSCWFRGGETANPCAASPYSFAAA